MSRENKILLVEGDADKNLFEAIRQKLSLDAKIQVASPKDFSIPYNTKGGIFNLLPTLIDQMKDGQIERFAAVMDADHPDSTSGGGMGYRETVNKFTRIVEDFSYTRKNIKGQCGGLYFSHNDGLNDIGLWVMPDNKNDGITESWLKKCIIDDEKKLLNHAQNIVSNLPHPVKFKDIHRPKAEIATWLAWQKMPGQEAASAMRNELIDMSCPEFRQLTEWLTHLFR